MASTYLNDLRIEEQAQGENSGTWGNKVNSAFSQIAEAFSYGTKQLAADANETFTMPDGTSDGTRSLYLKITSAGSLTATRTVTLGPNTVSKLWIIENATTGSQSITIAQGSGGTVTIPTGAVKMVYSDGAGSGAAVVDALTDVYLASVDHAAFGDNKKAIFGAGSDLQIYHDGSNSYIDEGGTGDLFIRGGADIKLQNGTGTRTYATFTNSGDAKLFYDNAAKLATTSTGIDVTGTVTADGLTVDGESLFQFSNNGKVTFRAASATDETQMHVGTNNSGALNISTRTVGADVDRIKLANNGDISFYEDTGTTAKFFWDASAESLGLGDSTAIGTMAAAPLRIGYTGTNNTTFDGIHFLSGGNIDGTAFIDYRRGGSSATSSLLFGTSNTEAMRIDGAGNVGIGTTSPETLLMVEQAGTYTGVHNTAGLKVRNAAATTGVNNPYGAISLSKGTGSAGIAAIGGSASDADVVGLGFFVHGSTTGTDAATRAMSIDSAGNVGIGTDNPDRKCSVSVSPSAAGDDGYRLTDGTRNASLSITGASYTYRSVPASAAMLYNNAPIAFLSDSPTGRISFHNDSSETMRIDSSGNVIIANPNKAVSDSAEGILFSGALPGLAYFTRDNALATSHARLNSFGGVIRVVAAGTAGGQIGSGASGALSFYNGAGTSERMRIDSSGNVGIGTTSPAAKFEVAHTTTGVANNISVYNSNTATSAECAFDWALERTGSAANIPAARISAGKEQSWTTTPSTVDGYLKFLTVRDEVLNEAMRIDSSGNLLVGKTSEGIGSDGIEVDGNNNRLRVTRDGNTPLFLNRKTSDGTIAEFRKDGTTVGSIGSSLGAYPYIGVGDTGLRFTNDSTTKRIEPWDVAANSTQDNLVDLGVSGNRFDDIYATNGTINTSDRNEKQDIEELSEAEQRVAVACKGLLRKFRWKSSVEENGDDARIHFGIIAQDLQAAFEAEGLDAGRYAMFINSTWTDEETGEEHSRMGVRYSELFAFIIAAI